MILLICALQWTFIGMYWGHVIDWNPWVQALPLITGLPLWALWTRAKTQAVRTGRS